LGGWSRKPRKTTTKTEATHRWMTWTTKFWKRWSPPKTRRKPRTTKKLLLRTVINSQAQTSTIHFGIGSGRILVLPCRNAASPMRGARGGGGRSLVGESRST
jgi:hypothetical protein